MRSISFFFIAIVIVIIRPTASGRLQMRLLNRIMHGWVVLNTGIGLSRAVSCILSCILIVQPIYARNWRHNAYAVIEIHTCPAWK